MLLKSFENNILNCEICCVKDDNKNIWFRGKSVAEALEEIGDLRTLKQIIYRWDIDIYESNIFLLARKLAIRYRKTKNSVIPVYRQRFRFLVKRVRAIIVMIISSLRGK